MIVDLPRKGRGAASNRSARYESISREAFDDGWGDYHEPAIKLATSLTRDCSRSVITYNESPDIPFDRSINPYRGCEHGCIYCYARPTHAWLGLSPGLDFESKLFFKEDAAELLRRELSHRRYRRVPIAPIALGANTDGYQPVERHQMVTRAVLEVLHACNHPVRIITKAALVERDLDLLAPMAARGLCAVHVSITTLDRGLSRRMEPRAASPDRRLRTVEALSRAGVPVGVLVAPIIPALNDSELERIMGAARDAGALEARWILLRLPLELEALFREWLETHYPLKAAHVFSLIRDTRGGKSYQSGFGVRMRGTGAVASLLARRFEMASRRLEFPGLTELDCSQFRPPVGHAGQLDLF